MSDVAMRAYLAGLAGGERLQTLIAGLDVPLISSELRTSLVAETLFGNEDIDLVETLAVNGNELAAWFLVQQRQHVIEENLGVDV